jgi:nucleotide-binding universal stress UspA family protein
VIREAGYGHIARGILAIADECDARIIVVGWRTRTDLPHIPIGSVANRLLRLSHCPVLVVPRQPVAARADEPATVSARQASVPAAG